MLTDAEIGEKAAEIARQTVLDACRDAGLETRLLVKGILAGLKAKEVKAHYDKDAGAWTYSKPMVAWPARQKAIDQGIGVLGIRAADKHDITTSGAPISFGSIPDEERELILEASRNIQRVKDGKP